MKRLLVASVALVAVCAAEPAFAFHPFDAPTGYVIPERLRRGAKAVRAPAQDQALFAAPKAKTKVKPAAQSEPQQAAAAKKKKKIQQQDDEDDKPQKVAKQGPKELDGGGRPGISPVAPPTVSFPNSYGAGSIVIDTAGRRLYYILSSSSAYRYPIAVGRQGFTWSGTEKISREVSWPDWRPPAEMLERRPDLPEFMTGGIRNPLGAKALYLGNTLYRIHGTNDSSSIGTASSSGCIRMTNGHVVHLASIAGVGTTVRVLHKLPSNIAKAAGKSKSDG